MSQKIILIDVDGVLADFDGTFLKIYKQNYPNLPVIELSQRRGMYLDQQYKKDIQDKDIAEQCVKAAEEIFTKPGFFGQLKPFEKAVEAVGKLFTDEKFKKNFKIFFLTSPLTANPTCASDKFAWIEQYFSKYFKNVTSRIIISADKTLVHGDCLIDDKMKINGTFKGPVRTWVIAQISVCPFSGGEKYYRSMRVTFLNTFWMGWSDALLEKN